MRRSPPLVVLDLNIVVSGLLADRSGTVSPPARCLDAVRSGKIRLCLSENMLARLRQVLAYPRLAFSEEAIDAIVHQIAEWVMQSGRIVDVPPAPSAPLLCDDPEDDHVLRAALLAAADYLVTGDADLLRRLSAAGAEAVRRTGLKVVTAREFVGTAERR